MVASLPIESNHLACAILRVCQRNPFSNVCQRKIAEPVTKNTRYTAKYRLMFAPFQSLNGDRWRGAVVQERSIISAELNLKGWDCDERISLIHLSTKLKSHHLQKLKQLGRFVMEAVKIFYTAALLGLFDDFRRQGVCFFINESTHCISMPLRVS